MVEAYTRNLATQLNFALTSDRKKNPWNYDERIERAIYDYNHTSDPEVKRVNSDKISSYFSKVCVSGGNKPSGCFWMKNTEENIKAIESVSDQVKQLNKDRKTVVSDLTKKDVDEIAETPNIWAQSHRGNYAIADFIIQY